MKINGWKWVRLTKEGIIIQVAPLIKTKCTYSQRTIHQLIRDIDNAHDCCGGVYEDLAKKVLPGFRTAHKLQSCNAPDKLSFHIIFTIVLSVKYFIFEKP